MSSLEKGMLQHTDRGITHINPFNRKIISNSKRGQSYATSLKENALNLRPHCQPLILFIACIKPNLT